MAGDGNSASVPSLSLQLGEGLQAVALGEGSSAVCHSPVYSPPGNSFVRHNTRQLTRVYPLGLRMNSANYSPQDMWNSGCQLGEWGSRAGSRQGAALWGGLWGVMGGPSSDGATQLSRGRKKHFVDNNYY